MAMEENINLKGLTDGEVYKFGGSSAIKLRPESRARIDNEVRKIVLPENNEIYIKGQ